MVIGTRSRARGVCFRKFLFSQALFCLRRRGFPPQPLIKFLIIFAVTEGRVPRGRAGRARIAIIVRGLTGRRQRRLIRSARESFLILWSRPGWGFLLPFGVAAASLLHILPGLRLSFARRVWRLEEKVKSTRVAEYQGWGEGQGSFQGI